jgi:hypothetical protein
MKTITITDEQYEALKEMQNELKIQDNRSTRDPVYVIMNTHKVPSTQDYSNDYVWFDHHNSESIGNDEDLFNYMAENYAFLLLHKFNDAEEMPLLEIDEINESEIKDWFMTVIDDGTTFKGALHAEGISKLYYLEEDGIAHISGMPVSFFEKDLFEHLKLNDYHYSDKARTYACSLWRSSRMEELRTLLTELKFEESE